jgi:uncharacterized protein (TIGR03437 family)
LSANVSPNPLGGGKSGTLTITVNATRLPPNTYNGTVTVSGGGTSVGIAVSITTGGISLALSPNSVNLQLPVGTTQQRTIRLVDAKNNSQLNNVGADIQSNQNWLLISNSTGSSFDITVDATKVGAGTQNGTITVQYNGSGSPFVTVSLLVTAFVTPPSTPNAIPSVLNFSATQGRANPPSQIVAVTTSDGSTQGFTVTAMPTFASVTPTSGTASASSTNITVTVNTSALKLGQNFGTITLTLANGGATNLSVTATLAAFSISANPNSTQTVTLASGKSQVIPIQVGTSDNAAAQVSVTTQVNNGSGWLTTSQSSINAPQSVNITVSAGSMAVGNYTGSVTFACTGGSTCASVNVPVTLNVTALATLSANPSSLSFQASGGSLPASQTVSVTSSDQTPQGFTLAFSPQGSWLNVTANQTTTPATLTVSIVSLPAQNSSGSITITPANGAPVVTIAVSLLTNPNQPTISNGGVILAGNFGGFPTITPGAFVELYGSNLATDTAGWAGTDFKNNVAPTSLFRVSVQIDGKAAFVNFVSPTQVNVVVPDGIATGGNVQLVLSNANGSAPPVSVKAAALQPGFLAPPIFNINGKQYIVAFNPDGSYVLPVGGIAGVNCHPAKPFDVITTYGIGFGPVDPSIPSGTIETNLNQLHNLLQMFFGGTSANLQYNGLAPGYVGLYQFNVIVPPVSDNNAVPLTFNLGGVAGTQTLYTAVHQ